MQLLIIRHGQSANNVAMERDGEAAVRVPDPELTELGRAQARALADWLVAQEPRPQRIFSSLMRRTIETAAPLADQLGLPVEARADVFESGGIFTGAYADRTPGPGTAASVLAGLADSVLLPPEAEESGWYRAEVETAQQACARALRVAEWLHGLDEECVALVIHGAISAVLLAALLRPDAVAALAADDHADTHQLPMWFRLDNTSVSLLELSRAGVEVDWINRIDHLATIAHQVSRTNHRFPPALSTLHSAALSAPR